MRPSTLRLLKRLYTAAKSYNFHYGLARSGIPVNAVDDFHQLYQQGYIFSKKIRGRNVYLPTEKGKKFVLEQGQSQLFPAAGYYLFYLDEAYQTPYMFTKGDRVIQAKARNLEEALDFKQRAAARGMQVFFRLGFPERNSTENTDHRNNPDNYCQCHRSLLAEGH